MHKIHLFIALLALGVGVGAAQLNEVAIRPVPYAARPPSLRGEMKEYAAASGFRATPLAAGEAGLVHGGARTGFDFPAEATYTEVSFYFDRDQLYLALDWNDPTPACNDTPLERPENWHSGDGFQFSLAGPAGVTELVAFPVEKGRKLAVFRRRGTRFEPLSGLKTAIHLRSDGSGWNCELVLPWAVLGLPGAPEQALEIGWTFAWSGLGLPVLNQLTEAELRETCHTSLSLVAQEQKFRINNHLQQPGDWGTVRFGEAADQVLETSRGHNYTAVGCPAGSARIDGQLEEWPESAFKAFSSFGPLTDDLFSGAFALRFDAENLYLALRMRSEAGRPINFATQESCAGYGGGDCFQVRLAAPNGFSTSFCAWYDSKNRRPALTVDGKEYPTPFLLEAGAELAFTGEPQQNRYLMELKVPWKALLNGRARPPQAGEEWCFTLQPWWRMSSRFAYVSRLECQSLPPLSFSYRMPADGQLALGIFNARGELLRQLVKMEFRPRGPNTEFWDGKDQYGKVVPAGTYELRGIVTDAVHGVYEFTLGNPGNPPWPTGDGKGDYISDQANLQSVVTDGEKFFIAAPGAEKGFGIAAFDGRGNRLWGLNEAIGGRSVALALCRDKLYALYSGPSPTDNSMVYNGNNAVGKNWLVCLDKNTGQRLDFSRREPMTEIASYPYREEVTPLWELIAGRNFSLRRYAGQPRYFDADMGESTAGVGLAAQPERLIVADIYQNRLELYEPQSARRIGEFPLPQPGGLHALNEHEILAVSGRKVVKIDFRTNAVTPVIDSGLEAPAYVTSDRAGNLYVSDWGKSFQVKKFDRNGKFLLAIGRPGGRPWLGKFDRDGMLLPRGIAVKNDGELIVVEEDPLPKRVSFWDAASGRFRRDWIGPTPYGGGTFFWVDQDDPAIMHAMGTRFKVDWENGGRSEVLATEMRRLAADQLVPNGHSCMGYAPRVLRRDGREWVAIYTRRTLMILRREGDRYVPAAALGGLHRWTTDDGTREYVWDTPLGRHLYPFRPALFKGHAGDNFAWSDANGDGLMQPEEVTFAATAPRGDAFQPGRQNEWITQWGVGVAADGAVFFSGGCRDQDVIYEVKPRAWTQYGPVYDIRDAREFFRYDVYSTSGLFVDSQDRVIVAAPLESQIQWPDDGRARNALMAIDRQGRVVWEQAAVWELSDRNLSASRVAGEFTVKGIGPVLGTWSWWWTFKGFLVSGDGLHFATLLEDTKLGPLAAWSESANYYFQKPDGSAYIVNGANQALHVIRIEGLAGAQRFTAPLTISPEEVSRAERAQQVVRKEPPRPVLYAPWLTGEPKLDGELDEYPIFNRLDDGRGHRAEIALAVDGEHLHVAARVQDPTPLVNAGNDYRTLFLTGDVVDVMLGLDPAAAAGRREATFGDVRISLSVMNGQPICVLTVPRLREGSDRVEQLMAARFDRIAVLEEARIALRRQRDSYTLEAAIPWRELGLDAPPREVLSGDVGVVFSDNSGGREKRLYFYNAKTAMVADLTTEATLQPAEWGAFYPALGPNLLRDGSFEEAAIPAAAEAAWPTAGRGENNAVLELEKEFAASGRQALRLTLRRPTTMSEAGRQTPVWEDFLKSANDGKGGEHAVVEQHGIPVKSDTEYWSRFFFRGENLRMEHRGANSNRGHASVMVSIMWQDANRRNLKYEPIAKLDFDRDQWTVINNIQFNSEHDVAKPLRSPEGAAYAIFGIRYNACIPDVTPTVWLDNLELVEK